MPFPVGAIAAYCSHFAFLSHPLGVMNNVRCSSWAHWKARSGLPMNFLIELLRITAEALRAKIHVDRKLAISLQHGKFDQTLEVKGVAF